VASWLEQGRYQGQHKLCGQYYCFGKPRGLSLSLTVNKAETLLWAAGWQLALPVLSSWHQGS